jgi:hypothetical protein
VINKYKKDIIRVYEDINQIKIQSDLKLIKKDNELNRIIGLIKDIIIVSTDNNKL